jgi:hypothetical protein
MRSLAAWMSRPQVRLLVDGQGYRHGLGVCCRETRRRRGWSRLWTGLDFRRARDRERRHSRSAGWPPTGSVAGTPKRRARLHADGVLPDSLQVLAGPALDVELGLADELFDSRGVLGSLIDVWFECG